MIHLQHLLPYQILLIHCPTHHVAPPKRELQTSSQRATSVRHQLPTEPLALPHLAIQIHLKALTFPLQKCARISQSHQIRMPPRGLPHRQFRMLRRLMGTPTRPPCLRLLRLYRIDFVQILLIRRQRPGQVFQSPPHPLHQLHQLHQLLALPRQFMILDHQKE